MFQQPTVAPSKIVISLCSVKKIDAAMFILRRATFAYLVLLDLILIPQVVSMNGGAHQYTQTFRDKRYTLYTYLKMTGMRELDCVLQCSNDAECGSINHQKDESICELNQMMLDENHQSSPQLKSDKGWNHFIKRKQVWF